MHPPDALPFSLCSWLSSSILSNRYLSHLSQLGQFQFSSGAPTGNVAHFAMHSHLHRRYYFSPQPGVDLAANMSTADRFFHDSSSASSPAGSRASSPPPPAAFGRVGRDPGDRPGGAMPQQQPHPLSALHTPVAKPSGDHHPQHEEHEVWPHSPDVDDPGDVIVHTAPRGGGKAMITRWSHIDDLDSFFKKVYQYHQRHGFAVMMTQEVLTLFQVLFIISLVLFLAEFVDYPVLFR